jgi:hypothetical protein
MFDQLANALAPNFFRTKRPRRIAQQRLTHTGILILIFLPFSPGALQDAGDTFSRSVTFFSRQGTRSTGICIEFARLFVSAAITESQLSDLPAYKVIDA